MSVQAVPSCRETVVYYRGRASGIAPLYSSAKIAVLIAVCLAGFWILDPAMRETLQTGPQAETVAQAFDSFDRLEHSESGLEFFRAGLLVVAGLLALRIFWIWIGWNAVYYTVTSERIQYERGILSKTIKTIDLWRIRDLIFRRSLVEALFGIGSIVVVANDVTSRYSTIGPVSKARRLYDDLMEARAIAIRERGVAAVES